MAKQLNVLLISNDISTSHRLCNTYSYSGNSTNTDKNQHPPIIVKFSNRDKRKEIFNQRQNFREKLPNTSDNSNHNNLIPKSVTIRENTSNTEGFFTLKLTRLRTNSVISFYELGKAKF